MALSVDRSSALAVKTKFDGDYTINASPMALSVDRSSASHSATGLNVWDCGVVLGKFLEAYVPEKLAGDLGRRQLRGLELGCGTGVAGLAFAFMGQQVVLTDKGVEQAAATRGNIAMNAGVIQAKCGG